MLTTARKLKPTPSIMRTEINQSNVLIQAKKNLDLMGMRLFLITLSTVNPHFSVKDKYFDSEFKDAFIPTAKLSELLGGSRYLSMIPKACLKLENAKITFRDKYRDETVYGLFHHIEYKPREGLHVRFRNALHPYLLDLVRTNGFTSIKLEYLLKLTSTYAVRLLELLLQFQNIRRFKEAMEIERTLKIEQLRFMLNVPETAYQGRIDNFKKHVIDIPVKEICVYTPYFLRYRAIKQGNKIVAFKFMLATHMVSEKFIKNQPKFINEAIERLCELGFSEISARIIFNKCQNVNDCARRITSALILYERQKKKIRNRMGFLRRAIEGNWDYMEIRTKKESYYYDAYTPDEAFEKKDSNELPPVELKQPKAKSSSVKKKKRGKTDASQSPPSPDNLAEQNRNVKTNASRSTPSTDKFAELAEQGLSNDFSQEKRGGGFSSIGEIMAFTLKKLQVLKATRAASATDKSAEQGTDNDFSQEERVKTDTSQSPPSPDNLAEQNENGKTNASQSTPFTDKFAEQGTSNAVGQEPIYDLNKMIREKIAEIKNGNLTDDEKRIAIVNAIVSIKKQAMNSNNDINQLLNENQPPPHDTRLETSSITIDPTEMTATPMVKLKAEVRAKIDELTNMVDEIKASRFSFYEERQRIIDVVMNGMAPIVKKIKEMYVPNKELEAEYAAKRAEIEKLHFGIKYPRYVWVRGHKISATNLESSLQHIFNREMLDDVKDTFENFYGLTFEEGVIVYVKTYGDLPEPLVLESDYLERYANEKNNQESADQTDNNNLLTDNNDDGKKK